jgi:hypothetical protein
VNVVVLQEKWENGIVPVVRQAQSSSLNREYQVLKATMIDYWFLKSLIESFMKAEFDKSPM